MTSWPGPWKVTLEYQRVNALGETKQLWKHLSWSWLTKPSTLIGCKGLSKVWTVNDDCLYRDRHARRRSNSFIRSEVFFVILYYRGGKQSDLLPHEPFRAFQSLQSSMLCWCTRLFNTFTCSYWQQSPWPSGSSWLCHDAHQLQRPSSVSSGTDSFRINCRWCFIIITTPTTYFPFFLSCSDSSILYNKIKDATSLIMQTLELTKSSGTDWLKG